jgi:tetratricopeptide (TPR) repeat protein
MRLAPTPHRPAALLLSMFLALATLLAYSPVAKNGFVFLDDPDYITANAHVSRGLTLEGVAWAFGTFKAANWHPLTWISHMAAFEVFGPDPAGHHLIDVSLHAGNALLLFLLLRIMTGALWRSWAVAALFALHPLHVESVAWASERKDVLSTLCGFLALICYVRYAQRPSWKRYLPVVLCLSLSLLAKPMLVTLPCALLLLDYWPLQRLRIATGPTPSSRLVPLLAEKIPLLLLSAVASTLTYLAQKTGGAVMPLEGLPFITRLLNAVAVYAFYLLNMVWPARLSPIYSQPPGGVPLWQVGTAALLFAGCAALMLRFRRPYLATGSLWYLGMSVPVLGLVQVGNQLMADRYTYIPLVGVSVAAVWAAAEFARRWRRGPAVLAIVAGVSLIILTGLTRSQIRHWRDTTSLLRHAIEASAGNWVAHVYFGYYLASGGRDQEAELEFKKALSIKPDCGSALNNIAAVQIRAGKWDEALSNLREAVRLSPDNPAPAYNLGATLIRWGKLDEAGDNLRKALSIDPDHVASHLGLAEILMVRGRSEEALTHYRQALRLKPDDAGILTKTGDALMARDQFQEAASCFSAALRIDTANARARSGLDRARAKMSASTDFPAR